MLDPELHRALEQNEYLRLDNVLLARRAAQLERQLEAAMARPSGGRLISTLLGQPVAQNQELADALAEVDARLDENMKLQHAFLEQNMEHNQRVAELMAQHRAQTRLLCASLREAEAEAECRAAAAAAATREHSRVTEQHRNKIHTLNAVCLELRSKCASAFDELEVANKMVLRLRERDAEHEAWRARVRRAWKVEQQQQQQQQRQQQKQQQKQQKPKHEQREDATRQEESRECDKQRLPHQRWEEVDEQHDVEDPRPSASSSPESIARSPPSSPSKEPAWLSAAADLLGSSMGDALSSPYSAEAVETSARDPHATTATVDSTINEDDGETACDLDGLRAALRAERAERVVADERARLVREELSLSTARFQQQIATLSDALAEMHAKEQARRKKLEHLREQKRREQHQQQQEQVQQRDQGPSQDDGEEKDMHSSGLGPLPGARRAEVSNEVSSSASGLTGGMLGGFTSWAATGSSSIVGAVEGLAGKYGRP